ncbi:THO complex subunit 6 [Condylostylus longicornis]|uniref:THO complex subunit 6 n=1 Tax=Condylostylus longicornis TaxID=2530218 RepID=UPI00244E1116|nr:THO complex subunit 6 [Condylostylus longicornis]
MVSDKLKVLYNTVLSQTISSDGKWMFYGNNYGDLFVQNLSEGCETADTECYSLNLGPILSLLFYKDLILVGTDSLISAYKWLNEKVEVNKTYFQIEISGCGDINCILSDDSNDSIFIGCGNNSIYQICVKSKTILFEFKGHTNYIHCIQLYEINLYSAAEDGQIICWDINTKQILKKIKPYKEQKLYRPEFGNWQGSVAVYNDWLICGGGTQASLWHLPSSEMIQAFPFPGKIHYCDFIDETVMIAGESKNILYYALNGEEVGKIESDLPAIYNVTYCKKLNYMAISGAGNKVINMNDIRYIDYYKDLYKY